MQSECRARQVARLKWALAEEPERTIPATAFFRVQPPRQGLTGYYYRNGKWEGSPLFKQVTPFFALGWSPDDPFPGPFSIRFVGTLRAPKNGRYFFGVSADDGARLILDGKVIGESLIPFQSNGIETSAELATGDHPIELDYFQMGGAAGLQFSWQPPGGSREVVPPTALIPDAP